jgi:hypothetical protein
MTPLEIFRQIWAAKIPADALTLYETVNAQMDLNDAHDPWAAVILQPDAVVDVTLGSNPWVEETGAFVIGLFTRSGKGPAALDQAVQYVRQTFHGVRYGGLLIEQVNGPHDVDPEAIGNWWQLALSAPYKFQTRRDASTPLYGDWQAFPQTPPPPLPDAS